MKISILILQKTPIKDHKGQKKERPKKGQKTNSPQEKKQINKNWLVTAAMKMVTNSPRNCLYRL